MLLTQRRTLLIVVRREVRSKAGDPVSYLAQAYMDNDNDNDTLRKVPHPSNEGLALQARVKGS